MFKNLLRCLMVKYYPALHSLRGFAAIWVYLLHVRFFSGESDLVLDPFFKMGWVGVHLFYVLSSFLLGSIYFSLQQQNKWNLSLFYKKRFLRIFPAYYVQLLVLLVIAFITSRNFPAIKDFIAHLFMYFYFPPFNVQPINRVWWTLPIEFSFYLILPLMVAIIRKFGLPIFIAISMLITYSYRYWISIIFKNEPIGVIANNIGQLPGVLIIFSLGLSCAYILHSRDIIIKNKKLTSTLILFAMIMWSGVLLNNLENYWSGGFLLLTWETVNALIIVLIIASIYQSNNKILTHKYLVFLGKISYGIYLWHFPIILLLKDSVHGFYPLLITCAPITLILAFLSYHYVERRFTKLI